MPIPSPGTRTRGGRRDPYIDNVKGVLITLVVVGHVLGKVLGDAPGSWTLYTWIYLFHMPAFVVLSGMLTAYTADGRRLRGLVQTVLVPYVVFQLAYSAFYEAVGPGVDWTGDVVVTPVYHLWFLAALFVWRLTAPVFAQLRPLVGMTVAVALSLLAGATPALDATWASNRAAGMLPFFVAGLYLGRGALPERATRSVKGLAVLALMAAVPLGYLLNVEEIRKYSLWNTGYSALGSSLESGVLIRLGMLAVGFTLAAAVYVLTPRRRNLLTGVGERSMYPYLLHGFAALAFAWSALDDRVTTIAGVLVAMALSVLLTVCLAAPQVQRVLRPLVEPDLSRFFTRDAPRGATGRRQRSGAVAA
jgi:fucose 4-O-acetylase-like acetyltransferase